ncbi:MAG: response regulator [bacterium]|nr:response regulator [bacterium]
MSRSVLIVDDEQPLLEMLETLLGMNGYSVHTAGSAEDALKVLDEVDPDVGLFDMMLPGLNGLRLTARLKAEHRSTVVIIMTGQESNRIPLRAIQMGAFDYLQKPFSSLDTVTEAVERAHAKNREIREREFLARTAP